MAGGQARYPLFSLTAISTFLYFSLLCLDKSSLGRKSGHPRARSLEHLRGEATSWGQNPGSALGLSWRKAESSVSSQTRHTNLGSLVSHSSAGQTKYQGWVTKGHFVFHYRHYLNLQQCQVLGLALPRGASDIPSPK